MYLGRKTFSKLVLAGLCALGSMWAKSASADPILYIIDNNGTLGTVNLTTDAVTVLGSNAAFLGDIGFDGQGNLYGINIYSQFFSLNKTNGAATQITTLSPTHSYNSLVGGGPNGTLYAAEYDSSHLYTVSTTGATTDLGDVSYKAAGDLAIDNGFIYQASQDPANSALDVLAKITPGQAYTGTEVGPFGIGSVYGLAADDSGTLYAVAGTEIYTVNLATAALTPLLNYGGHGLIDASGEAFANEAKASVPEPTSVATVGLLALGLGRRARRAKQN